MKRTFGVDLSNYTTNVPVPGSGAAGGLITDELVAGWKAAGFTHAIIGTQWPVVAAHQLEVCHRGGMTLDLYSWLDWSGDITEYLQERLKLAQGYPIGTHYLDAEQNRGSLSPVGIDDEIRHAVSLVVAAGQKPGIYTAAWWWPDNTGNDNEFSNLPLYHAAYVFAEGKAPPQEGAPQMADFRPYGGWTVPTIWQYAGSVKMLGANLDLDVMDYDPSQEANNMANLNADGSQKIVSDGNFVVLYNGGVPVRRWGSTDGQYPGRESKLFGNTYLWFRTLDPNGQLVAPYWSPDEGD